jgi:hypothetical protein
MATANEIHPLAWLARYTRSPRHSNALRHTVLFVLLLLCSIPVCAQYQQPFVFSTAGAVMTRNDQTGVLTPVAGSPFAPALLQTLDVTRAVFVRTGIKQHSHVSGECDDGSFCGSSQFPVCIGGHE